MIMILKQRKRKRFKDKIEPQQIKPDKLSSWRSSSRSKLKSLLLYTENNRDGFS